MELPILGQEKGSENLILGIDLGTTHSLVAVYQHGESRVLCDEKGSPLIPSVVSFPKGSLPIAGEVAKARAELDPNRTIHSVKRLIGRSMRDIGSEADTLSYKISNY